MKLGNESQAMVNDFALLHVGRVRAYPLLISANIIVFPLERPYGVPV